MQIRDKYTVTLIRWLVVVVTVLAAAALGLVSPPL
jgi:hypothetical protein